MSEMQDFGYHPHHDPDDRLWERDPDTEDNVLDGFNMDESDDSGSEIYRRPIFLDRIISEVSDGLVSYGWDGAEEIDEEKFSELCDFVGVAPEPRRALMALEDVGFAIEQKLYESRLIGDSPTINDIEEIASNSEPLEDSAETTIDAYNFIRRYIKDPILEVPMTRAKKELLVEEIGKVKKSAPKSFEEFDEKNEKIQELDEQLEYYNDKLSRILEIDEITERRERAFRRMHWLMKQDYLNVAINEFLKACKTKEIKPDFEMLAGYLGGRYGDSLTITNGVSETAPTSDEDSVLREADEAEAVDITEGSESGKETILDISSTRKYYPGVIDVLLQEHQLAMRDSDTKTDLELRRDKVMLRRLMQAKAICVNVFQNDITDGIYHLSPIPPREYSALQFVRERFYNKGDICVLRQVIELLPGSRIRENSAEELNDVQLPKKFSGRSMMDIFREIDTIIDEHPELDIDQISHYVEGWEMNLLPDHFKADLGFAALTVLEKLALKEKHSVRELIK